jgi:hydrogenase nickel incorporation protein HypA/HybF
MHELSIAQSIVEMAEQQAASHHARTIEELELVIGTLSGVDWRALEFALESAVKGTMLENARIVRHVVNGSGICGDCGTAFPVESLFMPCPACGSYAVGITGGEELRIRSLLVR